MANHEHKIDHLNQAYYGPSIPQAESAATRRRFADPYSLFCKIFRVFTVFLIAIGVVALVLWLVYQPDSLKAYVDSATLTRFDMAPSAGGNGTLYYNLTVDMSIRNPNRKQSILFERLEAVALYDGQQIGYVDFPRMRQPRKSTVKVRPSFHGQAIAVRAKTTFEKERGDGFFNINVKLNTRVRLKIIIANSVEYRPDVDCYIRVADPHNATAVAQGFTRTQCHVDDFS